MNDMRNEGTYAQATPGGSGRLDSWKKIAAHFKRDVTTVQRWERSEGMPVHRHLHQKQGSVFAFRSELDAWWQSRRGKSSELSEDSPKLAGNEPPLASQDVTPPSPPTTVLTLEAKPEIGRASPRAASPGRRRIVFGVLTAALLVLLWAGLKWRYPPPQSWHDPLANATFTRLTDWPGTEQAAEISRDGRWAAFLAERDGLIDAWLTQIGSGKFRNLTHGGFKELVNPSIRTLGFSGDGSLVTVWTRHADGSSPEDIKLMSAPISGGELHDFLPGVAEVAWSHRGGQIVYHTTAPGDPLFVRDERGIARRIYAAPTGVHCHFPQWALNDEYIYFTRGIPPASWDIWRIRPSGEGLERMTSHDSRVSHLVMLDQRTLAYLATDLHGSGPWVYALDVDERVPRRISIGLERYTSLAVGGHGHLVATVETSDSSMWRVPLETGAAASNAQNSVQPASLFAATGLSPRAGPDYLLYVSSRAGRQSIWKATGGQSLELWSSARELIVSAPTITQDGQHIAFTAANGDRTILYTLNSDGTQLRTLDVALDLRGSAAWAPDGRSIVTAALHDGSPRLTSIFLDGSPPRPLVSEYSIDPVVSPDGRFLIYSGADVGTTFPLRAVALDGRPYPIPALMLTRGARRVVFGPDGASILLLRGEIGHKDFWLVDLRTAEERRVSNLAQNVAVGDFDLSRDGREILFDSTREISQIALIEPGG